METLEREDEAVPLTADVAVELRRILQHVYAIFEILDQNEDFEEPAGEVRPAVVDAGARRAANHPILVGCHCLSVSRRWLMTYRRY